jgi:hypothetical protein
MVVDNLVASRGSTSSGRRERERERGAGADGGDSVRVCVRIRPLNAKEQGGQTKSCIRIASSVDGLTSVTAGNNNGDGSDHRAPQQLVVGKDRSFTFDTILGVSSGQDVRVVRSLGV